MTVTDQQLRALAFLTKSCRPTGARRWDEAGIAAALERVRDRDLAEVIVATIRAAADRDCETPGVIPSAGSHWQQAASVKVHTPEQDTACCRVCGLSEPRCRGRWKNDHEFESRHTPRPAIDVHRTVAALKAEVAPIAPRTEPTGLDALTTRRPDLAAAAEQIAARNPGLKAPDDREVS